MLTTSKALLGSANETLANSDKPSKKGLSRSNRNNFNNYVGSSASSSLVISDTSAPFDFRVAFDLYEAQHRLHNVFSDLSIFRKYIRNNIPEKESIIQQFKSTDCLGKALSSPSFFYGGATALEVSGKPLLSYLKESPLVSCQTLASIMQSGKFYRPKLFEKEEIRPRSLSSSAAFIYETLFVIEVYNASSRKRSQLIHALASNSLLDVRDKIICISDDIYESEKSIPEKPDAVAEPSSKPCSNGWSPKSSFFLIENCFYNDTREGCYDFSACLMDSATSADSMNRTLQSLPHMKCHYPYLFSHFGDCEHYIYFRELRRFRKPLPLPLQLSTPSPYPLILHQAKLRRHTCFLCNNLKAKYVTLYDRLAPENPCFFCEACYYYYHYDEKGNLIYSDFEVYKYLYDI